jgi:hypothetical protein
MEIKSQTKEDSNREQREAFLKLAPKDRFYAFLDLCENLKKFPVKSIRTNASKNFVIEITTLRKE